LSQRLLRDTNILSELIKDPHGRVARKVLDAGVDNVCTSIIAAAELRYGALKKRSTRLRRQAEELLAEIQVLPLDEPVDAEYGKLRVALETAGKMLAANDLLIAAHANAVDAAVVTSDHDFKQAGKLVQVLTWRY
jgi:tRNA(fMet)-specific endonuclease VapC